MLWAVRASVHVPAAASALTLRTLPALASSITDLPGLCSSSLPHVVSAAALPTALQPALSLQQKTWNQASRTCTDLAANLTMKAVLLRPAASWQALTLSELRE